MSVYLSNTISRKGFFLASVSLSAMLLATDASAQQVPTSCPGAANEPDVKTRFTNIAIFPDDATVLSGDDIRLQGDSLQFQYGEQTGPAQIATAFYLQCTFAPIVQGGLELGGTSGFWTTGNITLVNDFSKTLPRFSLGATFPGAVSQGGSVAILNFSAIDVDNFGAFAISEGDPGKAGGPVLVYNGNIYDPSLGTIKTQLDLGVGILAHSLGGSESNSISSSGSKYTVGGNGGIGASVTVVNSGSIETNGLSAAGISGMSIGGGGGLGFPADSDSLFSSIAVGGTGGSGGSGGFVRIVNGQSNIGGIITTKGLNSAGIQAQSVGGGGGDGGAARAQDAGPFGGFAMAVGGAGGAGGHGGGVEISHLFGTIKTEGKSEAAATSAHSVGILAQSIGGGGGNGGHAVTLGSSGGIFPSINVDVAKGGAGGAGGDGDTVRVTTASGTQISTIGRHSGGIVAQSIGGGGGNGGTAVNADSGGSVASLNVSVSMGGHGSGGGTGDRVTVDVNGSIQTSGDKSIGMLAQSISGSGGNGGNVISTTSTKSIVTANVKTDFGGTAGNGAAANQAAANLAGTITTFGDHAAGLFAQSIGGGGGNGGSVNIYSLEIGGTNLNANVDLGGIGGNGGHGGQATSALAGTIETFGVHSYGAHLQSVGGGGGNGGHIHTLQSSLNLNPDLPTISATVNIGGRGGSGGDGGLGLAVFGGNITTHQARSFGLAVQSVGGGGGSGGASQSISATSGVPESPGAALARFAESSNFSDLSPKTSVNLDATVNIGGKGGSGGAGGAVDIELNGGSITTLGPQSHGIVGHSVGGGGGMGGNVNANGFAGIGTYNLSLGLGGSGGAGGQGGTVTLWRKTGSNRTTITTQGNHSFGILAQSIGGGGGEGGSAHTTVGKSPALSKTSTAVNIGGNGGAGNVGGAVSIEDATIRTTGIQSHGVKAQSIGGGGGNATVSDASGASSFTIGGSGGSGNHGGTVTLTDILVSTEGDLAAGVIAQSIGGGGGTAGVASTNGLIRDAIKSEVESIFGLNLRGGDGDGGAVNVNHGINTTTAGKTAVGIFAQSIGGGGSALFLNNGSAPILLNAPTGTGSASGRVTFSDEAGGTYRVNTSGNGAVGIVAQSISGGGGAVFSDGSLASVTVNPFLAKSGVSGGFDFTLDASQIRTTGDFAPGLFLQSGNSLYTVFAADGQKTFKGVSSGLDASNLQTANRFFLGGGSNITTFGERSHGVVIETNSYLTPASNAAQTLTGNDRALSIWLDGNIDVSGDDAWAVLASNNWTVGQSTPVPTPDFITTAFTLDKRGSIKAASNSAGGINLSGTGNVRADINGLINADTGTAVQLSGANITLNLGDPTIEFQSGVFQEYYGNIRTTSTFDGAGSTQITLNGGTILYGAIDVTMSRGATSTIKILNALRNDGGNNPTGDVLTLGTLQANGSTVEFDTIIGNVKANFSRNGFVASLQNLRFMEGSVTGPFDYTIKRNAFHALTLSGTGGASDTIAVNSLTLESGASTFYNLISIPTPDFKPILVFDVQNGQGLTLESFNIDNDGSLIDYSYDLVRTGNRLQVTITDISFNLNPAGLSGEAAKIAPLAQKHVDAIKSGALQADPNSTLYRTLLNAATSPEGAQGFSNLEQYLDRLKGTAVDPDSQSHTNATASTHNGMNSCGGEQTASVNPIEQGECLWSSVTITDVELGGNDHAEESANLAFGAQFNIGGNSFLGFAAGYDDVDIQRSNSIAEAERFHIGGIYKYVDGNWFLSSSVVGSFSRTEGTRSDVIDGGTPQVINAGSDRKSVSFSGRARSGYLIETGFLDVTPMVDFDAFWVHQFSYSETDAGGLGSFIDDSSNLLVDVSPRVQLGSDFKIGEAGFRFFGNVGARFALNDPIVNVGLANGLAGSGTIDLRQERENHLMSYGFGMIADLGDQFELRVSYDLIDGARERHERIGFKLGWKF